LGTVHQPHRVVDLNESLHFNRQTNQQVTARVHDAPFFSALFSMLFLCFFMLFFYAYVFAFLVWPQVADGYGYRAGAKLM
jgi:hypothetical protein